MTLNGDSQIDLFGGRHPAPVEERAPVMMPQTETGLPDAEQRRRIVTDLKSNLLVEAGAGAGKTTEMVLRMVALVGAGVSVDRIAAVTFTRKAATELRERFQTRLEQELRRVRTAGSDEAVQVVDRALREIDRAFIGTIHAFCARLLRERPLEAGVDPSFRETFSVEQERIKSEYFATHIERLAAAGDPDLAALAHVGLRPDQLRKLFDQLTEHGDVRFPTVDVPRPDPAPAREALDALLDEALALMPAEEPDRGWDNLQSTIRRLRFYRDIVGWDDDILFLHVLAETLSAMPRATYRRWADGFGIRDVVRALEARFQDYSGPDGEGGRILQQWWAHRYPIAIRFARKAARAFEAERLRTGALSFQDLLMCTVRLLREHPRGRADLGERYRHILVDEFQDTDPMQAEILFLLASPPVGAEPADWRKAVPRDGALFVVGDPKQSIYRFRRADITIYSQVKQRFEEIGGVVTLTANFRSGPAVERLVDSLFSLRFPPVATEQQAAFAPLQVQQEAGPGHGVFSYIVAKPSERPRQADLADQEARRVASWIEMRIHDDERSPDDFLLLARTKKHLIAYAREIEARNLPVQVTGGGVGIEEEMSELRLLLHALADPGDAVRTVAVLVGLFFGLDFEQLAEHVIDRNGRLEFVEPRPPPQTPVETALSTLHEFWTWARAEPADVLVSKLVYRLGLLPYAAAGELGESRAGALLFVLEAVRAAALQGDASLRGAITAIDAALDTEEAEAPLEPGRPDAIRVMNLHQAKGLEAKVVILAAPFGEWKPAPVLHITRAESGHAEGRIVVAERRWRYNDTVLARPLDWNEHEAAERDFQDAERDRLLYVAATRAKEELVIARYPDDGESPWSAFYPHLEVVPLELPVSDPPPRVRLELEPTAVAEMMARVEERRTGLAAASYSAAAVRTRVKSDAAFTAGPTPGSEADDTIAAAGDAEPSLPDGLQVDRVLAVDDDGMAWGKLVHESLEAAGRGRHGDELRSFCRTRLLAVTDAPINDDGDDVLLDRLLAVVESVTRSAVWQRAQAADETRVEAPFSIAVPATEFASMPGTGDHAAVQVIDGVIDLVFREADGWVVVDYKSDRAGRDVAPEVHDAYRRQVELYADCWARLTGAPVKERILLFTTDGAAVSF